MLKKIIAVICIVTLMVVGSANVLAAEVNTRPFVWLYEAIWENVELNGLTGYILTINNADEINLTADDIILNGFEADISIYNFKDNRRLILLSDIVGLVGEKTISIKEGIASNTKGSSLPIHNSRPFYLNGLSIYVTGPEECKVGDTIEIEVTSDAVWDVIPNESYFLGLIDNALEFKEVSVDKSKCVVKAVAKNVSALSLTVTDGGYYSNSYKLLINSNENY